MKTRVDSLILTFVLRAHLEYNLSLKSSPGRFTFMDWTGSAFD
jgi:hypothetical protein